MTQAGWTTVAAHCWGPSCQLQHHRRPEHGCIRGHWWCSQPPPPLPFHAATLSQKRCQHQLFLFQWSLAFLAQLFPNHSGERRFWDSPAHLHMWVQYVITSVNRSKVCVATNGSKPVSMSDHFSSRTKLRDTPARTILYVSAVASHKTALMLSSTCPLPDNLVGWFQQDIEDQNKLCNIQLYPAPIKHVSRSSERRNFWRISYVNDRCLCLRHHCRLDTAAQIQKTGSTSCPGVCGNAEWASCSGCSWHGSQTLSTWGREGNENWHMKHKTNQNHNRIRIKSESYRSRLIGGLTNPWPCSKRLGQTW